MPAEGVEEADGQGALGKVLPETEGNFGVKTSVAKLS